MLNKIRSNLVPSVSLEEALLKIEAARPNKMLFRGESVSGISSYLAAWMSGEGINVIVLDGANGFDPYMVSSFARKALLSPEKLLKKIRIARAFTCYQMATLVERLALLLDREKTVRPRSLPIPFRRLTADRSLAASRDERFDQDRPVEEQRANSDTASTWGERAPVGVILLGPITTFLDEDVPEREVEPLFERALRKMEAMAEERVPFLLFQSCGNPRFSPFAKGGMKGIQDSRGAYLMKRLFQFSSLIWKVSLEADGPKLVLEKGLTEAVGDRGLGISRRQVPKGSGYPRGSDGPYGSSF